MAPLLILKNACAALTSYFYLARFVRRREFAVLGSLLYAFSGFMFYNTFFNHFHEVVVFFPLLLIGMEELGAEQSPRLFRGGGCIKRSGQLLVFHRQRSVLHIVFCIPLHG